MNKAFVSFALVFLACMGCTQMGCLGCEDDNPCTYDSCKGGECVHKPLTGPVAGCSGSGGCIEYTCSAGQCLPQKLMGCCGDGVCDKDEDHIGCPADCRPTCVDGVLNQGEDDVDCGGPCPSCDSPQQGYLQKVSQLRTSWMSSTTDYTQAIRDYNRDQDRVDLKRSALAAYSDVEPLKAKLSRLETPEDMAHLSSLFNNTLSLYMSSLHHMVLYVESGGDDYRLKSNMYLTDAMDSDRMFVSFYNEAVDKYNRLQRTCSNYLLDKGEPGVDCGQICRRPCTVYLNVTKHVMVRSEAGGDASIILNISSPAIDDTPIQQRIATYLDPQPKHIHQSPEGNTYYLYGFDIPGYGVRQIKITESVRLTRTDAPVKMSTQYFDTSYQLSTNMTPLSEDICYRAKLIRDQTSSTSEAAYAIQEWIRQNIDYESNDGELGAEYCYLRRRGACDEQADLFISMARCIGIPARRVTGNLLNSTSLSGHAWAQYYDSGWIYVDPSAKSKNQGFAPDNKHVTACVGEAAYKCGLTYTYTYTRKKPTLDITEKVYLS